MAIRAGGQKLSAESEEASRSSRQIGMNSGRIALLKELQLDRHVIGSSLRVTGTVTAVCLPLPRDGRAESVLIVKRLCLIEHTGSLLWVDITLIKVGQDEGDVDLKESSLVQFIGEVCSVELRDFEFPEGTNPVQFYLIAKVARIVDGLDIALYEQSLQARRALLAKADCN